MVISWVRFIVTERTQRTHGIQFVQCLCGFLWFLVAYPLYVNFEVISYMFLFVLKIFSKYAVLERDQLIFEIVLNSNLFCHVRFFIACDFDLHFFFAYVIIIIA